MCTCTFTCKSLKGKMRERWLRSLVEERTLLQKWEQICGITKIKENQITFSIQIYHIINFYRCSVRMHLRYFEIVYEWLEFTVLIFRFIIWVFVYAYDYYMMTFHFLFYYRFCLTFYFFIISRKMCYHRYKLYIIHICDHGDTIEYGK